MDTGDGLELRSLCPAHSPPVQEADPENCFDDLERQFSATDPLLVRTAVIAALHQGLLVSQDLQHQQWGRSTRVSKLSKGSPHATR